MNQLEAIYIVNDSNYQNLTAGKFFISLRLAVHDQPKFALLTNTASDGIRSVLNRLGKNYNLKALDLNAKINNWGYIELRIKKIPGIYFIQVSYPNGPEFSLKDFEECLG